MTGVLTGLHGSADDTQSPGIQFNNTGFYLMPPGGKGIAALQKQLWIYIYAMLMDSEGVELNK